MESLYQENGLTNLLTSTENALISEGLLYFYFVAWLYILFRALCC